MNYNGFKCIRCEKQCKKTIAKTKNSFKNIKYRIHFVIYCIYLHVMLLEMLKDTVITLYTLTSKLLNLNITVHPFYFTDLYLSRDGVGLGLHSLCSLLKIKATCLDIASRNLLVDTL